MDNQTKTKRKTLQGVVVSNKMQKTVTVKVNRTYRHPSYGKVITRGKKYYVHNENENINVGDPVTIQEVRPLSKLKRWRVVPST